MSVYALIGAVRLEAQWGELKRRTLSDELKAVHFNEHVRIDEVPRMGLRAPNQLGHIRAWNAQGDSPYQPLPSA